MKVGTAWEDITPDRPIHIAGQLHARMGEYTHDPLTVNAAAFECVGTRVVLVSCDLLFLTDAFTESVKAECEQVYPSASVIIACTHTHLAPCTTVGLPGSIDQHYMETLREKLVAVIGQSLDDLEEAQVYAGEGWLDELGFNRRGLHGDGLCDMYYGCWNEDFAGLEGPRDGALPVIFARRMDCTLKLVIPSFATHPNSMEGESYYSADIVGSVRAFLRHNLGEDLVVVYLTGAGGNTSPWDIEHDKEMARHWYGEEGWKRCGTYIGSEILKVVASTRTPLHDVLALEQTAVDIPIRPYPSDFDPETMPWGKEYFGQAKADWPCMLREESPASLRLNVLRVGDAAICTNPGELYVEHGLAIRKKSPARVTLISELSDGYAGYVPTASAFKRGGYSTWPADTSKLAEDAGDTIVRVTRELLDKAFASEL